MRLFSDPGGPGGLVIKGSAHTWQGPTYTKAPGDKTRARRAVRPAGRVAIVGASVPAGPETAFQQRARFRDDVVDAEEVARSLARSVHAPSWVSSASFECRVLTAKEPRIE